MDDILAFLTRAKVEKFVSDGNVDAPKNVEGSVPIQVQEKVKERLDSQSMQAAIRLKEIKLISQSGLFDREYYLNTYNDIAQAGVEPIEHFYDYGFTEGRKPNPYFDPLWYLAAYQDVHDSATQPLFHYAAYGDKEGRSPGPLFDTKWYRENYNIDKNEIALRHYLSNRTSCMYSPIKEFDVKYYIENNKDVQSASVDPFEHFILYGYREHRNPSEYFDVRYYAQRYCGGNLDTNPFLHYLEHKNDPGIYGCMPDHETTIFREIKKFAKHGPFFEEFRPEKIVVAKAKILAYYLPQFHAFAENDAWWGSGFTEWTNISRGVPRFVGHYQPRVPRDLGFYNLLNKDVIERQINMAKKAGLHGFVFYYYWFNGKRIMEQPIEIFLNNKSLDMPFCLMWANENWTRRWDGAESEVLISQDYRPDDDARMTAEFARHFADHRYIRIDGRPLLMIYRPKLIPNTKETIQKWRQIFKNVHGEQPLIIMAQSFDDSDPGPYGLDGAIEFPPHKLTANLPPINIGLDLLDQEFKGKVYNYEDVIKVSINEGPANYPLIKTAVPSWDNDARRQGNGLAITGSTPDKYENWLTKLIDMARDQPFHGEPIVCINAWNEWCEGAYLEPDLYFGAAYLNATSRAITGFLKETSAPRLLLIGHDAFPSGAQMLLLSIGRTLKKCFGFAVEFLLLDGGKLESQYKSIGPTEICNSRSGIRAKLGSYFDRGFASAIINTTAAAHILMDVRSVGMRTTALVHELPRIIKEKNLIAGAESAVVDADQVVFPAPFVRDELLRLLGREASERVSILPQGVYKDISWNPESAAKVRAELSIGNDDAVIVGIGYADMRKGFDLFLQLWRLLHGKAPQRRIHLIWVGAMDPDLQGWLAAEIDLAATTGTFHLLGFRQDVDAILSAASVFALTSREDPFPTVALEALSVGLPVVAFDATGGIPDMLQSTGQGMVVPYGDVLGMANAIEKIIGTPLPDELRKERQALVTERFQFKPYVKKLVELALPNLPQISVAVPNYNYARYMEGRLGTIFQQTHPIHEIVVIDDCSKDDSAVVIPRVAADWGREIDFVKNEKNSGSVFAAWRKAAELTTGEYIWIAEADDLSHPEFLAKTLVMLKADPMIQFAFTDSSTVLSDGAPQWKSYKDYYSTVAPGTLSKTMIFDAPDFIRDVISVKNLILNVSAVVWRREALLQALEACNEELRNYRVAGDWRLYLEVLARPGARVAYEAEPLNIHRRHAESVTHKLDAEQHLKEIADCHAVVCGIIGADDKKRNEQSSYLNEIANQLDIKLVKSHAKNIHVRQSVPKKKRMNRGHK
ncbi:Glycosyltransferase [Rhodovastum atsumiense]|uniref:Glycosyltransferase n=1 Tax=Rhodovastum atsumiense TaxID=504468 RepID=A0A5M6IJZ6_9PROT|nr:glycoside hydrolase family 99-like domain-containing protein [Rhodovastum atsumiense]KAA5608594.1 glycosyltransferase [Rhodovastum atsumiense]CAH2603383.1 Glycosyltransferase [Rhodovastum atsumiense]